MTLAMLALNFVYAIFFMVVQFGSMFWFMGRTRSTEIHPGDPKTITWDDYWGQKHLVERVKQWNKLLVDRGEFVKMGGQALNGILMDGPPGTGKTMMAKALAGSGGVAFLGVEGSTFRGMFWGMDTLKMMGFVSKARKLAERFGACIAYIDEIDAVGSSRGAVQDGKGGQTQGMGPMGMMGSGALTRLLYEMDGMEEVGIWGEALNRARGMVGLEPVDRGKVMFMGATNRPDVLDPALLRPGRFDQIIHVDAPDEEGRREVIEGYLAKIATSEDFPIDVDALVMDTPLATPAHIMSVITKDAPREAIFNDRDYVIQSDLELGFQEKLIGIANPISNWDPKQKKAVAAHEAGHAIAMLRWRPLKRFVHLSIIRRGRALGYALDVNPVDVYAHPQSDWVADVYVSMAGNIASEIIMGEFWTGMGGDLMHVREVVFQLFAHGAFGSFPVHPTVPGQLLSGAEAIDEAVDRFINGANEVVEKYLRKQIGPLSALTDALFEREDMTGDEAKEIVMSAVGGSNNEATNSGEQL
jgi:cell division protease FtsH